MPNDRRYKINVPELSSYFFRVLSVLSDDEKAHLHHSEQKLLRDDKSINRFVSNNPLEYLLFLWAKLGFEFRIMLGPTQEHIQKALDTSAKVYEKPEKQLDAIETLVKEKVFVLSSTHVMTIAQLCAQNVSTRVYHISQFTRHMVKARKDVIAEPYDKQLKEAIEGVDVVNRLIKEQLICLRYAEEKLDLPISELKLLSALYSSRNTTLTLAEVAKATDQDHRTKYVCKILTAMEGKGTVICDRERKTRKKNTKLNYMISTKGIGILMRYHYYVWERAFKNG